MSFPDYMQFLAEYIRITSAEHPSVATESTVQPQMIWLYRPLHAVLFSGIYVLT